MHLNIIMELQTFNINTLINNYFMKNYLKLVIVVAGIVTAGFGSIEKVSAKENLTSVTNVTCEGSGHCGYTNYPECKEIIGTAKSSK